MNDQLGKHWQAGDGYHLDVSNLDPPEPLVAILELIERPDMDGPVIFHHTREPVFLYPELNERGWQHEIIKRERGEVCLKVTRRL